MGVEPQAESLTASSTMPMPSPTMTEAEVFAPTAVLSVDPDLVVFDSAVDFYGAASLSENDNSEINQWHREFAGYIARYGRAAVVQIEAVNALGTHGHEERAPRRTRPTCRIQLRADLPDFDRATSGEVRLIIEKDRRGMLPGSCRRGRSAGAARGHIVMARLGVDTLLRRGHLPRRIA